jgi:hypothetical protein
LRPRGEDRDNDPDDKAEQRQKRTAVNDTVKEPTDPETDTETSGISEAEREEVDQPRSARRSVTDHRHRAQST